MIRFVLVTASILLIGAQGEPDPERDPNREVASLDSLKYNAQPRYGGYGGGYGYNGYPSMGYPSYPSYPAMNPGYPAMNYPIGGSSYYPNYGYPNTGYYPQPAVMEPSPSKPDYNKPTDVSDTGATVVDEEEQAANNLPNWNQNNYGGWEYGLPNWSNSYTPMPGGCYNRCRPKCFQPQPPPFQPRPPPLLPPRPPMPPIMPPRIPPKPMCRQTCRPQCNVKPRCGMGGSEFNGNSMRCLLGNKPNYIQGGGTFGMNYNTGYPGYGYPGYGYGMMQPRQMAGVATKPAAVSEPELEEEVAAEE